MSLDLNNFTRSQLYRISRIDGTIKAEQYPNSRNLAEDLGVSRRTILRDIEFIKDSLNAPLDYCPKKNGYYYTEPGYSVGIINLTEGELVALYLGHNILSKCRGTPYAQPVVNAFNKICCSLQDTVNIDLGKLSEFIKFDLEPLRGEEEQMAAHFTAIGKAIKNRKQVKLNHYAIARDKCQKRLVEPYELRYYQGSWYLIGFCHLRKAIRIFALDRIRDLEMLSSTFIRPDNFDSEKYFLDAFQLYKGTDIYKVKVLFDAKQARWIKEKQWHITQKIDENPDGSIILNLHTSGLEQLLRWILSFGSHAKVLEPPELVLAMEKEIASLSKKYKKV